MRYLLCEFTDPKTNSDLYLEWDDESSCLSVTLTKNEPYRDINVVVSQEIASYVIERVEIITTYLKTDLGPTDGAPWEFSFPFVMKFYQETVALFLRSALPQL